MNASLFAPVRKPDKFKLKPNRKYIRGRNPCYNCSSGNGHWHCRPKLDGTLCSCSCKWAQELRDEVEACREAARLAGEPEPTIEECMKVLRPGYKVVFNTN